MDGLSGLFLPQQQKSAIKPAEQIISNPSISVASGLISSSIQALKGTLGSKGKVFLVVDQPDLLLAATGDKAGAPYLGDMLLALRDVS